MTEPFPSFNSDPKNEEAVTETKYQFGGEAKIVMIFRCEFVSFPQDAPVGSNYLQDDRLGSSSLADTGCAKWDGQT